MSLAGPKGLDASFERLLPHAAHNMFTRAGEIRRYGFYVETATEQLDFHTVKVFNTKTGITVLMLISAGEGIPTWERGE
jgi:hypothetical protein